MGDHLEKKKLMLYSLWSQVGVVVMNHPSHLYSHCVWVENLVDLNLTRGLEQDHDLIEKHSHKTHT